MCVSVFVLCTPALGVCLCLESAHPRVPEWVSMCGMCLSVYDGVSSSTHVYVLHGCL